MKTTRIFMMAAMAIAALSLQSCKDDDDPVKEFIADDNTFKSYMSWQLEASHQGPDPTLGNAHAGNDSTVTRYVYFKDGQDRENGTFPVGTLILKNSKNTDGSVNLFVGMAKRGNSFSPSSNDWEWFVLNTDGTIAVDNNNDKIRGANIMGGACVSCHNVASSDDYVFSK